MADNTIEMAAGEQDPQGGAFIESAAKLGAILRGRFQKKDARSTDLNPESDRYKALSQSLHEKFINDKGTYYFRTAENQIAFKDHGDKISTKLEDAKAIDGMLNVAEQHGWDAIKVKGSHTFRREAWIAAQQRGLDVVGYEPTPQELAVFGKNQNSNSIEKGAASPAKVEDAGFEVKRVNRTPAPPEENNGLPWKHTETVERFDTLEGAAKAYIEGGGVVYSGGKALIKGDPEEGTIFGSKEAEAAYGSVADKRMMEKEELKAKDMASMAKSETKEEKDAHTLRKGGVTEEQSKRSMEEALSRVRKDVGDQAKVFLPETGGGKYRGEVIASTDHHVVQKLSPRSAVIHKKEDVANTNVGAVGTFVYRQGRAEFSAAKARTNSRGISR